MGLGMRLGGSGEGQGAGNGTPVVLKVPPPCEAASSSRSLSAVFRSGAGVNDHTDAAAVGGLMMLSSRPAAMEAGHIIEGRV